MKIRVGSRSSNLSLKQTEIVLEYLKDSGLEFEIKTIKTKGDEDLRPLYAIDTKGVFVKELDIALLNGEIDMAVHSMKDIPSTMPEGLVLAAVPRREEPNDVLISKNNVKLKDLKPNAKVGTSSLRRYIQLRYLRNDLDIVNIRGNVETRINKMLKGEYDAIVLAEAGLKRLGLSNYITERFDIKTFVPAPCQGALGVVTRSDDKELIDLVKRIEDRKSRLEIEAERVLLREMNAGCRLPLGAICRIIDDNIIMLYASVFSIEGNKRIDVELYDKGFDVINLAKRAADKLIENGALELAKEWR